MNFHALAADFYYINNTTLLSVDSTEYKYDSTAMPADINFDAAIVILIFISITIILIIIARFAAKRYTPEYYGFGNKKGLRRRQKGEYPPPPPGGFGPLGESYGSSGHIGGGTNTGSESSLGMIGRGIGSGSGGAGGPSR